jgi:hypothetical protein
VLAALTCQESVCVGRDVSFARDILLQVSRT